MYILSYLIKTDVFESLRKVFFVDLHWQHIVALFAVLKVK